MGVKINYCEDEKTIYNDLNAQKDQGSNYLIEKLFNQKRKVNDTNIKSGKNIK